MKVFIHFWIGSLNNLAKNLAENGLCHLSQEFEAKVLDLVKNNKTFPRDYWDSFEKVKEGLPTKVKFFNSLAKCSISDINHEHFLNVYKSFKMKTTKIYHDLYPKYYRKYQIPISQNFRNYLTIWYLYLKKKLKRHFFIFQNVLLS